MGHSSKGGYCLVCEYIKRLYNVVKSALHIYQTEEISKKNTPKENLGSLWVPLGFDSVEKGIHLEMILGNLGYPLAIVEW